MLFRSVTFAYAFTGSLPYGTSAGTTTGTFGDCKGIGAGAASNYVATGLSSTSNTTESDSRYAERISITYTIGATTTTETYYYDEATGGTLESKVTNHPTQTVTVTSGIVSLSHTDCGDVAGTTEDLPFGAMSVSSGRSEEHTSELQSH